MDDDPTIPLRDKLGGDKHVLAAARLEKQELVALRTRIEEAICQVDRVIDQCVNAIDSDWTAIRKQINAETDSPLESEAVKDIAARCLALIGPCATTQFCKDA